MFSRSYTNYQVRERTYCKLHIKHTGPYTTDRFQHNNMNIQVENAYNVDLYLVYVAPGASFSSATIEQLYNGQIKSIYQIYAGQNWWVMYEPAAFKTG